MAKELKVPPPTKEQTLRADAIRLMGLVTAPLRRKRVLAAFKAISDWMGVL